MASEIPKQWKEIGYSLGLKYEELEEIENEKETNKERFTRIFVLWKKQGGYEGVRGYKWIGLLEALKSIKEYQLAAKLEQWLTPKDSNQKAIVQFGS